MDYDKQLAPIVIFVYKRIDCTKRMLESLQKDSLASESIVYIFSDGSKNSSDEKKVQEVRHILDEYKEKNCFKKMYITKQEKNCGLANSIINGVSEVIEKYNKVIVLEDDLIVQGNFLSFMNEALNYYENNQRIWSISGYTPNLVSLKKYRHDVYFGYRASSWGWATWKDRWNKIDWTISDYKKFRYDIKQRKRFCKGGNDLPSMLKAQMNGKIDSWAVRWCYNQSKYDMLTVFPKKSRIRNEGFNEEATHTVQEMNKKMYAETIKKNIIQNHFEEVQLDDNIVKEIYEINKLTLYIRIRDKFRELNRRIKRRK